LNPIKLKTKEKMMKACGIELKANDAILTIVEQTDQVSHIAVSIKKISLGDSESTTDIIAFKENVETFFSDNGIEKVFIKKRATKGKFAGGSNTFKMEALIQLITEQEIILLSSQSISAFNKKHSVTLPESLKKYQHESFLTAVTGLSK